MGELKTEPGPRYLRIKRHLCGCLTRFDVVAWRSETVEACSFHGAHGRAGSETIREGRDE